MRRLRFMSDQTTWGAQIPSMKSLQMGQNAFCDVVRDVSRAKQTLLVDAARAEWTLEHLVDGVHYRPAGTDRLASMVAAELIESGWIERVLEDR